MSTQTDEDIGQKGTSNAVTSSNALYAHLERLERNIEQVFRGRPEIVRLAVACLLAEGHLLLEDVPGVGKTTLARALARSIDLPLRRIQFTSDMLPSDILGVSVFDETTQKFQFHPGPIFNNIVLADEINRASPRTQSALLEAMHEGNITVDAETRRLPRPFFVIATQNPFEFHGTYPLPESQLDRFLLRLSIGYPEREIERELLRTRGRSEPVEALEPVISVDELNALIGLVDKVHVDDSLLDYLMEVATATRESSTLELGVSTRACLTTLRAARAYAVTMSRDYLLPDDLRAVLIPAFGHRVRVSGSRSTGGGNQRTEAERLVTDIIDRVPLPL